MREQTFCGQRESRDRDQGAHAGVDGESLIVSAHRPGEHATAPVTEDYYSS